MAPLYKREGKWQGRICRKDSPDICKRLTLPNDAGKWGKNIQLQFERGEAPVIVE